MNIKIALWFSRILSIIHVVFIIIWVLVGVTLAPEMVVSSFII